MMNKYLLLSALFIASTAQAAKLVTYNPPLAPGVIERFNISDNGADVSGDYTIQSIAPDPISGYTPAKSSKAFRAAQSGAFIITYVSSVDGSIFTDTANMTAAPAYIQLSSGSGQNAATGATLPQPIKVLVSDSSGNPISGATVTWSITGSGGSFSPSVTDSSGLASSTLTMGSTPGTYSVTATAGAVSTTELIQETANPSVNQLTTMEFQSQPGAQAQKGLSFSSQPVMFLKNGSGVAYTIPTTVTASAFSNSSCTTPATLGTLGGTLTATSNASGVATFTNLNYSTNDSIFVKMTAGSISSCSQSISVVSPTTSSSKLTLNFTPTSAYVGTQFNFLVNVSDGSGNIVSSASNLISLAAFTDATCSTPAAGTLSGNTPINAYQGQALFNSLSYSKADSLYFLATATGLTSVCSPLVTLNANPLNIATKLAFFSAPSSEFAGQSFGSQPFTTVQNSLGSLVQTSTSSPITIAAFSDAACSAAASGTLSGTVNLASAFGVGAFTNLSYSASGTIYLGISSAGLTSACSTAITMNPTAASQAAKLKFTNQPSSSAIINTFLASQPSIEVDDSSGAVVTGVQGYIAMNWFSDSKCTTPVSGMAESNSRIVNGAASFSYLGGTTVGTYYLGATFNNLAVACSTAVVINPNSPTCLDPVHLDLASNTCQPNTQACSITNGTGTQNWTGSGSVYTDCTLATCNSNYYISGNTCVLDACVPNAVVACPITNGTGQKTCTSLGDKYGSCAVVSCNSGFTPQSGSCVIKYDGISLATQGSYSGTGTLNVSSSDGTNFSSSPTVLNSSSVKDGSVLTVTAVPYIGSLFNSMSSNQYGFTTTSPLTYTLTSTDTITPSFVAALNGPVNGSVVDANGDFYVVGGFTSCGSLSAGRIAKIKANGTCDTVFNAGGVGFNNTAQAIAMGPDGNIYVGGFFTSYNGVVTSANRIARLNATTGALIKFNPADGNSATGNGLDSSVYALAFDASGNLWIGGSFTTSYILGGNGTSNNNNYIAKWAKSSSNYVFAKINGGDSASAFGNGFQNNSTTVRAIAIDPSGNIWVGGVGIMESYIGGSGSSNNANGIAKISPSGILLKINTSDTAGSNTNGISNSVYAIASDSNGNIYVGGNFQVAYIGGSGTFYNANNFLKISPAGILTPLPGDTIGSSNNGFNNAVNVIKTDASNNVYVGGNFQATYVGGSGAFWNAINIAKISAGGILTKINAADGTANGTNGVASPVYSIQSDGAGGYLVGGGFTTTNFGSKSLKQSYFMRFDSTGTPK
jgi:hypothetical protein